MQVDGGEVVIVSAENFWNELTKVTNTREVERMAFCIVTPCLMLPEVRVMALLIVKLVLRTDSYSTLSCLSS